MSPRPALNQVLGALGGLAGSSLFRNAVKHWYITGPLGVAAFTLLRERHKKGQLTLATAISDLTPMVTLTATLVILNHTLETRDRAAAGAPAPAAPKAPLGPIREASFTPSTPHDDVVPATPLLTDES